MSALTPIPFKKWIDEHRHLLKPPVGNQMIWKDREFIVMVVGGPNARDDFHVNNGEEFFHQIEGDMTLKTVQGGAIVDIPIRAGEIFLLPPRVPHSPQRPAGTIGMVIERIRAEGELDAFEWYCPQCNRKLYSEQLQMRDIVKDLPPIFERFYNNVENSTCKNCGVRIEKRKPAQ